ncbi:hypothetical protein R3P38DRAFT_3423294 [Favolaschia claudopus]|uniref:Uncharacterized protein n=1 Tax=Favolaschia claudopus TaxID=2862362 RepID=A0AAW0D7Y5_9AGAR
MRLRSSTAREQVYERIYEPLPGTLIDLIKKRKMVFIWQNAFSIPMARSQSTIRIDRFCKKGTKPARRKDDLPAFDFRQPLLSSALCAIDELCIQKIASSLFYRDLPGAVLASTLLTTSAALISIYLGFLISSLLHPCFLPHVRPRPSLFLVSGATELPNNDHLILTTIHNDKTRGTAINALPRLTHRLISEPYVSYPRHRWLLPNRLDRLSTSKRRLASVELNNVAGASSLIALGYVSPSKRPISSPSRRPLAPRPSARRFLIQSSAAQSTSPSSSALSHYSRGQVLRIRTPYHHRLRPIADRPSTSASSSRPLLPAARVLNSPPNLSIPLRRWRLAFRRQDIRWPTQPTQVLSPRLPFSATTVGAPNFQSPAGVIVVSVMAAASTEEENLKEDAEGGGPDFQSLEGVMMGFVSVVV